MKEKKITIAKYCGFCPGVKKAIDTVLELARKGKAPIYTLGPLIHNTQVIQTLEEKGIKSINSTDEIKDKKAVLVIRAHGITPKTENNIRSLGLEVIDGTCPLVKNAHRIIEKYALKGYSTVIVGDKGHAEVTGLLGYTQGRGYVVRNLKEAEKLPSFDKVNIVAQTTQQERNFKETAGIVAKKAKEYIISDTICLPTKQRQKETVELAKNSDLVIVVGGKNSANTGRLAMLCRKLCPNTIHIETENELTAGVIEKAENILVTSGASTPNWITQRISNKIRTIAKPKEEKTFEGLKKLWSFIINGSIYCSLAAVALSYTSMKLQGLEVEVKLLILVWLFVFSLTIVNRSLQKVGTEDSDKVWLFQEHRKLSVFAGFIAGVTAVILSAFMSYKILILLLFFWAAGIIYPLRSILKVKIANFFPASKDIVTAFGWTFVCVYIPALYKTESFNFSNYAVCAYGVILVFIRSVLLSISGIHSDLILGSETLYKAAGRKNTYKILFTLFPFLWIIPLGMFFLQHNSVYLPAFFTSFYVFLLLIAYYREKVPTHIPAETLLDAQFFIMAGVLYLM